jgi:hypothetical protein
VIRLAVGLGLALALAVILAAALLGVGWMMLNS